jgi:para-aminobenzoate synthetase/4-amino-4-deoxychorismate lyase
VAGLRALPAAPTDVGRVALIVRRRADGVRETPAEARLTPEEGLPGDGWRRRPPSAPEAQLAVMRRDVGELVADGQPLTLFGDNLVVDLDISAGNLPVGTRLRVGGCTVEVTPKPHNGCAKFQARFGADALRFVQAKETRDRNLRGIYWRVVEPGPVRVGDEIRVLARPFRLYEALLWEPPHGYFLLDHHLARLQRSAAHFGFAVDGESVRKQLSELAERLPDRPRKVRVEASANGELVLEHVDAKPGTLVTVALATEPVASDDEFLRHKTSRRGVYERARAAHPEADDVLLWNERRELTELCSSNVVLEIDGRRVTPHASCGLLPGTFRAHLLERGEIEEAILPVEALARATRLWLINSVRRWAEIRLVG